MVEAECCCERSFCLWWKQSAVVSALSVWKIGHGSVVVSVTGGFGHSSVLQ